MKNKPIARKSDLVIQEAGDELLIYDLKTNKAYCLNETSAIVWQLCDGDNSIEKIANEMSKQLKVEISEDFVWLAIDQLNKDELIENVENLNNQSANLSRREIIRKVGFASAVALPIVSGIIAPKAISAQSGGLPLFATCTGPNCAPGLTCRRTFTCTGNSCVNNGIDQCCSGGGRTTGSTFCGGFGSCAPAGPTHCCSGTSANTTDDPSCLALGGVNTCICT